MSVSLSVGSASSATPLASAPAWDAFQRWADALPVAGHEEILHLVDHGWTDAAARLAAQIDSAIADHGAPAAAVAVAGPLRAAAGRALSGEVLVLTDGVPEG